MPLEREGMRAAIYADPSEFKMAYRHLESLDYNTPWPPASLVAPAPAPKAQPAYETQGNFGEQKIGEPTRLGSADR